MSLIKKVSDLHQLIYFQAWAGEITRELLTGQELTRARIHNYYSAKGWYNYYLSKIISVNGESNSSRRADKKATNAFLMARAYSSHTN